MATAIGVLCARVRVEEKQLLAALAEAGAPAMPLPPTTLPLPVGPSPSAPPLASFASGAVGARIVVDRCQDRVAAAAVLPAWRALGVPTVDAGVAATGDRLTVAARLAAAGVPRPETRLVCSESAAFAALAELGYPATFLPLTQTGVPTALLDRDLAEAVLEHRTVLGSAHDALALVQAGAPAAAAGLTIIVVGGRAIAIAGAESWDALPARVIGVAEAAAGALAADLIGVELAWTAGGPVVWDVQAVPEFRHAAPLGRQRVAEALAELVATRFDAASPESANGRAVVAPALELQLAIGREVTGGVALTA